MDNTHGIDENALEALARPTMNDSTAAVLLQHWSRSSITLMPPAAAVDIKAFEDKYSVQLPDDIRDYFLTTDGFAPPNDQVYIRDDKRLYPGEGKSSATSYGLRVVQGAPAGEKSSLVALGPIADQNGLRVLKQADSTNGGKWTQPSANGIDYRQMAESQKAGLVEIRQTLMNGVRGVEYRFRPQAMDYLSRYFGEIPKGQENAPGRRLPNGAA